MFLEQRGMDGHTRYAEQAACAHTASEEFRNAHPLFRGAISALTTSMIMDVCTGALIGDKLPPYAARHACTVWYRMSYVCLL